MRNGFFIYILLLALPNVVSAQKNSNIFVKYDIQFYSGMLGKSGILESDGNSSIFKEGQNLGKERIRMGEDGNIISVAKMEDTFTFVNFKENKIISKRTLGSDGYKVHEDLKSIEWQLIPGEIKNINGFKSYKAKGEFRGRNYVAWYSPDIPLRVGPWKFQGLPGLILDIRDSTNNFQWTATEIVYPYSNGSPIEEPNEENLTEISLKDYVILMKDYSDLQYKKRIARAPQGVRVVSSTSKRGVELTYEWEKE